jgi:hypothetical protein
VVALLGVVQCASVFHRNQESFVVTDAAHIYRLSSDVLHAEVSEEIVLMDCASGKYFGVKGALRHVFGRLREGASLEELVSDLASRVDVSREQAEQDIGSILSKMESAGLVVSRK